MLNKFFRNRGASQPAIGSNKDDQLRSIIQSIMAAQTGTTPQGQRPPSVPPPVDPMGGLGIAGIVGDVLRRKRMQTMAGAFLGQRQGIGGMGRNATFGQGTSELDNPLVKRTGWGGKILFG